MAERQGSRSESGSRRHAVSASRTPTAVTLEHVEELARAGREPATRLALRRARASSSTPLRRCPTAPATCGATPTRRASSRAADPSALAAGRDRARVAARGRRSPARRWSRAARVRDGRARRRGAARRRRRRGPASRGRRRRCSAAWSPPEHGFVEAINAAAWRGGVLVRVPAGVDARAPDPRCAAWPPARAGDAVPRVLVVVGAAARRRDRRGAPGAAATAALVLRRHARSSSARARRCATAWCSAGTPASPAT